MDVSERRVRRVLGHPRSTQRYKKRIADYEDALTSRIVALASQYGRYGYRRVTAMLRTEGWQVNHKRVERIWRKEGLTCAPHGVKCPKTTQTRTPMAQRWFDRAFACQVLQTCLEL